MKRKDSEVIVTGIREIYDLEIAQEKESRIKLAERQIALDSRMLLIQDLQDQYPEISTYLQDSMVKLQKALVDQVIGELPTVSWTDRKILQAHIEQDRSLDNLSLQELADILRPYSRENWLTWE